MTDDEVLGIVRSGRSGDGVNYFFVIDYEGQEYEVRCPNNFHYEPGDEFLKKHDYSGRCMTCRNEKLYDEAEETWYCPLGHE